MLQYILFWGRTGGAGYSFRYGVPVVKLIGERLPNSAKLGAAAAVELGILPTSGTGSGRESSARDQQHHDVGGAGLGG